MKSPRFPEARAIARLCRLFPDLPRQARRDLSAAPADLRNLFRELAEPADAKYRQGRVVILTLTSRAFQLYLGGLQQLPERNLYVWACCCRGLLETIGAIEYARADPKRVVHLFTARGVSAGKLKNALGEKYTVTRKDIDKLSRTVHPADLSVWATIRSEGRKRTIYFGGADFSGDDVLKAAALLFQSLSDFNAATRSLIEENGSILEEGSVFMTAGSESGRR